MLPRNIFLLFLSCLTLTMLSAQEPDDEMPIDHSEIPGLPPAEEEDLLCRCVTTFLPEKNDIYYFKIGKDYHQVELIGEGITTPFPVRGTKTFSLYKKAPADKDAAGKDLPPYLPIVQQALEGGGKDFIVVLGRKDNKSPLKSRLINISKANCPADSIHLYNESPATLGMQIEEEKATLEPYKNFRYSFSGSTRDSYTTAKIVMRYKGENKIMASRRLRLVPGRRMILICFPSENRAKIGSTPLRMITYQDKP